MKVNLSSLMEIINENEKEYFRLTCSIKNHVFNSTVQELNGTINVIEDNKKDFEKELLQIEYVAYLISKLKSILYEKNNSFKLSDGRTIQAAIVENTNLRKLRDTIKCLLNYKSSKQRMTEVNNSYFQIQTINYDKTKLEEKITKLDENIRKTDFEISKLNSIEFDIEL